MKTRCIALSAWLLLGLPQSAAADAQADYDRGMAALHAGDAATAQDAFQQALAQGGKDPAVYHALGNALFRQGEGARALAAWRRGQRLAPRNGDLAANIDKARLDATDRIDPPGPGAGPTFWLRFLSPAEAALIAGLLGAIGALGLLLRAIRRRKGAPTPAWGAETLIGLGGGLALGASVALASRAADTAIVLPAEVAARSALGPDGIDLFVVHAGAELRRVEPAAGHWLVALPDDRRGWLPEDALLSTDPEAPFKP